MEPIQARPAAFPVPAESPEYTTAGSFQGPVDAYTGPAPRQGWTLAQLEQGDWATCQVIGARIRTFPFPLKRLLGAGASITQAEFRAVLARATFTSMDGTRLRTRGSFPTTLGTSGKWYFVKSPWGGRIYAFRDKWLRSTAKADAQRWADQLARTSGEPHFFPARLDDNGFVMGKQSAEGNTPGLPPPSDAWFYFDVI